MTSRAVNENSWLVKSKSTYNSELLSRARSWHSKLRQVSKESGIDFCSCYLFSHVNHRTFLSLCHHLLQKLSVFDRTSWISATLRRKSCNAMVTKQNLGQWNLSVAENLLDNYGEVWWVFLCVSWLMDCETRIFLLKSETEAFFKLPKHTINNCSMSWCRSQSEKDFKVCVTWGHST